MEGTVEVILCVFRNNRTLCKLYIIIYNLFLICDHIPIRALTYVCYTHTQTHTHTHTHTHTYIYIYIYRHNLWLFSVQTNKMFWNSRPVRGFFWAIRRRSASNNFSFPLATQNVIILSQTNRPPPAVPPAVEFSRRPHSHFHNQPVSTTLLSLPKISYFFLPPFSVTP